MQCFMFNSIPLSRFACRLLIAASPSQLRAKGFKPPATLAFRFANASATPCHVDIAIEEHGRVKSAWPHTEKAGGTHLLANSRTKWFAPWFQKKNLTWMLRRTVTRSWASSWGLRPAAAVDFSSELRSSQLPSLAWGVSTEPAELSDHLDIAIKACQARLAMSS